MLQATFQWTNCQQTSSVAAHTQYPLTVVGSETYRGPWIWTEIKIEQDALSNVKQATIPSSGILFMR